MNTVACVIDHGFAPFEFGVACEAFGLDRSDDGVPNFDFRIDGDGFSDTRAAARRWFKIDSHSVVVRALQLFAKRGEVDAAAPAQAAERCRLLDVNAGTSGSDAE